MFIWSGVEQSAKHIQMKSTFLFWIEAIFQEISISRHVSSPDYLMRCPYMMGVRFVTASKMGHSMLVKSAMGL